jgi:hypothetical protein
MKRRLSKKTKKTLRRAKTQSETKYSVSGRKKPRRTITVAKPKKRVPRARKTKPVEPPALPPDTDPIHEQTLREQEAGRAAVEAIEHGEDLSGVQPVLQGDVGSGDPEGSQ